MQRLRRIPNSRSSADRTRAYARAGVAYGSGHAHAPHLAEPLENDAPFRQYVALDGQEIVGRVRSVDAVEATWCADMYVNAPYRRRGIGRALLCRMLRDDRARGAKCSVLTASHVGALLYPRMGYERIGTLLLFAPRKG